MTIQNAARLEAEFSSSTHSCAHCGAPCPPEPVEVDGLHFCCTGCSSVYALLKENNLCTYYSLNRSPGFAQSDCRAGSQFDWLDREEISRQLLDFSSDQLAVVRFVLPQIHCSSCIWLLEQLHRLNPGILHSEVLFLEKKVIIRYNPQQVRLSEVVALLHRIGYGPKLQLDSLNRPQTQPHSDWDLIAKLGVAGFCSGNIMLLSIADYLDPGRVDADFLKLFSWLSAILAMPVVFYSGIDILQSAWRSVFQRRLNIDVPLALGIVSMFLLSLWELLSGSGVGYWDSLTALVFILLIARWLQQKNYAFLSFERDYRAYFPLSTQRLNADEQPETVPVNELVVGDRIRVRNDELIPADSVLESNNALIDYSFLTGESVPVAVGRGQQVYAGGRNAGSQIDLMVSQTVDRSHLTQLWNHPAFTKAVESGFQGIIDQINRYFTPAALILAFGSALAWLLLDSSRALNAFLGVLVVACPCVLVLANPFALGHIVRILGRWGFYLKGNQSVEQLAQVDTVVFDKTGTLTQTDGASVRAQSWNGDWTDEEKSLLRTASLQSAHPLARALAHYLAESPTQAIDRFREITGKGIEVEIGGHQVRIGSAALVAVPAEVPQHEGQSHLEIDGCYRGFFEQRPCLRPGVGELLEKLKTRYDLWLVSGDPNGNPQEWTPWFKAEQVLMGQSPEEKLAVVADLQRTGRKVLMVGDGLNDAGALRLADAAISVAEDTSRFTPASDAILYGRMLARLTDFLELARRHRRMIYTCFVFSGSYNVVGLYFATQGLLAPVVAALLMPLSSVTVLSLATGLVWYEARRLGLYPPPPKPDEDHLFN
jgi:Cu+-exporting ATPase